MMNCHCFIRHAITPEERKAASDRLDYSRSIGDQNGMIIALAQLTGNCPARNDNEKDENEIG